MNRSPHACPITGDPMVFLFEETVLGRHSVSYFQCPACGLIQTESPHWLEEAYREPITAGDTGLVARNLEHSRFLETFLALAFPKSARFVDVAGGYGLLTRLLRDRGFDCYTTDPHCPNLFAAAFEPKLPFQADALFAFEVLEHVADPLTFLTEQFRLFDCQTLVFSTLTFRGSAPPRDWWYYAFETGQHISFYQTKTLETLAAALGCHYQSVNEGLHVMTRSPLPILARLSLQSRVWRKLGALYARLFHRRESRAWADHLLSMAKPSASGLAKVPKRD